MTESQYQASRLIVQHNLFTANLRHKRPMDKEILSEFIQLYKQKQCLWDTKSRNYSNRQLRRAALEDLLVILKKLDPGANIDSVRLKIDILRTNYNRERKKVLRSSEVDDELYAPTLWYYEDLNFLATLQKNDGKRFDKTKEGEFESDHQLSKKITKRISKKRALETPKESKDDEEKEIDEYDSFGKMIAIELRKLRHPYQSIAQKLICDTIFYSKLEKITEDTSIFIPVQNIRRTNSGSTQRNTSKTNLYEGFPMDSDPSSTSQQMFDDMSFSYSNINNNYQNFTTQPSQQRNDTTYMFPKRNTGSGMKILENYVVFKK